MNKKNRRKNSNVNRVVKKHGKDIFDSDKFKNSKQYIQHGKKSVFQHSVDVAKMSIKISRLLPFEFKEREIIRGALLHDYFLYDWHNRKVKIRKPGDIFKLHGFTHASTAMRNADRDFHLSEIEKEIIRKHMWPLNASPPKNREAWVVTFADKICSIKETVCRR